MRIDWQSIIKKAELYYESSTDDRGFRTWSLKKTTCNVFYYEVFPLDEIDKIFCSILDSKDGCISEDKLATILGFNIIDNFDVKPKRYADKAEFDIFKAISQTVIDWGLISKEDKKYILTDLGKRALKTKEKYRFYSGQKILFENANIVPTELEENLFFPFYSALGIFSEIIGEQQINYEDINLSEIFDEEESDLIKRHKLQSNENYQIYYSEKSKYFSFDSCQVDIKLYRRDEKYYPVIYYNNQISEPATELLYLADNIKVKEKKIEWGRYLKLIKDPNAILDYDSIIPFEDLLEFDSLIKDSRLVWNDKQLFTFIAENADANQWHLISNYCPIEVLKQFFDDYKDKIDWISISARIDNSFLLINASKYPWNFEIISSKEDISIEVIKKLLLIPELKEQDWDWETIMPQLDFEFIKSNIDKIDFELFELTKTETSEVRNLIAKHPDKNWDWLFISSQYDLSFILRNIITFQHYISLKTVLDRAFSAKEHSSDYCNSIDLKNILINEKHTKLLDYSVNQANYYWTSQLIDLLEETGYLTWQSGSFVSGFECNPNIEWNHDFFELYHKKVTTQKGYDFVSKRVSSYKIVLNYLDFDWNWDIISANLDMISNSNFILQVKDKLNFNELISNVAGEVLEEIHDSVNILSYLNSNQDLWRIVTEKYSIDFIRNHIDYDWDWNILTNRVCSSIKKIEALGNPKWIDKWDWKYLTRNLDFNRIFNFLDDYADYWDWEYITQKIDKEFITNNLPEYNSYWDWETLLINRLEKHDLQLSNHLPEIAACLSVFDVQKASQLWQIITRKFDYDELFELIELTYDKEVFNWDFSYFYNLSEFNPRKYIDENYEIVNWSALSSSKSLNNSLKWNKSLFNYEVWLKDVIKLLKNKSFKWNFERLSTLDSINWNDSILNIETEKWDWDYLSEFSSCFKKEKDFVKRFKKFSKFINFQLFSKRTDSDINEKLLEKFINENWDWRTLSSNETVKISLGFISNHQDKPWDWEKLSERNDIKFDNDNIVALSSRAWNWKELSKRSDIDFSEELVIKLQDKPFDWHLVSQNTTFNPTAKVLSILSGQDLAWDSISQNPNLSLEILWDYKDFLNWNFVTKHEIIDFTQISFLEKYQNYLDWNIISRSSNFDISFDNLKKFKRFLNWELINSRKDFSISEEMLAPFADVLDWSKVSESISLQFTEELIEKYRNKWDWQLLKINPQIIDKLGTTLRKYKPEFNCVEFLEKFDRTPYIYHYTHLYHAIDIINRKKIYSRNRAKELGLLKYDAASDKVVGRTSKAHAFARFYFRPQTPTQFYNECLGMDSESGKEGWAFGGYDWNGKKIWLKAWKSYYPQFRNLGLPRCPIPVFFKFDLKEVLIKMGNKCFYSTGNMQTNWASVKKVNENPNSINTIHLYSDISDYENYKQYSQQEFLVSEEFDFSILDSFEIICYNEEYAKLLKSQLGNNPICNKISANGWDVFHRGNRELVINETETEISIKSEYRDSAYLSIKGEDLKNIEILNPERIHKETANEIIAYPEIRFTKTEQSFEVHFVDTAIGKRDWLIYKN